MMSMQPPIFSPMPLWNFGGLTKKIDQKPTTIFKNHAAAVSMKNFISSKRSEHQESTKELPRLNDKLPTSQLT
jgi:hypothetical protein